MENLDTVAAKMGMGLFVDCARVSWPLKAFRAVSALTSGLVLIKRGVMLVDFKSRKKVIHVNLSICYLLGT